MGIGFGLGGIVLLIAILVISSFRVLREYERGVVFMLGRFWRVKGPGLVLSLRASSRWSASTCARSFWTCRRRT